MNPPDTMTPLDKKSVSPVVWVNLYHSALLELDPQKLDERVRAAEKAILERRQSLSGDSTASAELRAMTDAVQNLGVLKKELTARSKTGTSGHTHPELNGEYVAFVNGNRQYLAVTDGVCHLLGYHRDEMLRKTIDEVTAPEMANDVSGKFQLYVRQGFLEGEHILLGEGGRRIPIRYEARVFPDGCLVARWEPLPSA